MPEDHYKTLGVSRKATDDEIKAAYKKLAAETHPDKHQDDPHAEEKFARINGAYRTLRDAKKRAEYDAETSGPPPPTTAKPGARPAAPGTTASRPTVPPRPAGNNPMGDLLGGMGAGMFGGRGPAVSAANKSGPVAPAAAPPAASETPIKISIEDAMQGAQKSFKLDGRVTCPECRGSGRVTKNVGPAACPTCLGKGQARRSEEIPVSVPAGIEDGGKLRIRGKGPTDSRGQRGDLILTVRVEKDGQYQLEERNVLMEAAIPYTILVLGGEASVETPAGERKIKVPAGTQNGARIKMPGMGLPALGAKPAGDLSIKVKVAIPQTVGAAERRLLIELAKMRNETVNA